MKRKSGGNSDFWFSMLEEKISLDIKAALKARNAFLLSTLRLAQSVLKNKALKKRAAQVKAGGPAEDAALSDEEVVTALRTEVKKRKESAEAYEKGARPELAQKELEEAELLRAYLPKEADDAEVEQYVREVIHEIGADQKQFGKVMGLVMKKLAGRASGDHVQKAVKSALGI
ncbi:MAG: GatB/YqeY domain-containing protein [Candidatus Sungbacteria bacterium]|uniref:GatB/YqeY domain-containing protein n=1 Tax=Candidatus Sungiibacteriota bacterium TaxID=2750080 RepID=A0A9D6QU21_9BACT|nr:GatB/YqeY domain-containing protein [Candidatus Sungbacteria bacterium]